MELRHRKVAKQNVFGRRTVKFLFFYFCTVTNAQRKPKTKTLTKLECTK